MNKHQFHQIFEALLFASPNPLTYEEISRVFEENPQITEEFSQFVADYNSKNSGLQIIKASHGFLLTTKPELSPFVRKLHTVQSKARLTRAACEVLAIIAYRQPVTLPEIEHIRGVDSGGVIRTLIEKQLITILGKKQVVGNPILYGTTSKFLIEFGLDSLQSLPDLKDFEKIFSDAVAEVVENPGEPPCLEESRESND